MWVERRANFTRSNGVMSMAGYILGLGDRHPSNLMLDRVSGRVVHIDFGDCFEITKQVLTLCKTHMRKKNKTCPAFRTFVPLAPRLTPLRSLLPVPTRRGQRKNFPEIVPFRLTRMMTHGMGYLGIAGPYRLNCERVMRVLRDNRDSLMAMLEAFVYDPLISWLFLTHKVRPT